MGFQPYLAELANTLRLSLAAYSLHIGSPLFGWSSHVEVRPSNTEDDHLVVLTSIAGPVGLHLTHVWKQDLICDVCDYKGTDPYDTLTVQHQAAWNLAQELMQNAADPVDGWVLTHIWPDVEVHEISARSGVSARGGASALGGQGEQGAGGADETEYYGGCPTARHTYSDCPAYHHDSANDLRKEDIEQAVKEMTLQQAADILNEGQRQTNEDTHWGEQMMIKDEVLVDEWTDMATSLMHRDGIGVCKVDPLCSWCEKALEKGAVEADEMFDDVQAAFSCAKDTLGRMHLAETRSDGILPSIDLTKLAGIGHGGSDPVDREAVTLQDVCDGNQVMADALDMAGVKWTMLSGHVHLLSELLHKWIKDFVSVDEYGQAIEDNTTLEGE